MKKSRGKNNNIHAGIEYFYKLSLKSDFQNDLIKARDELGIPEKGYSDPIIRQKLWIDHEGARILDLQGFELAFKEKYIIPTPYLNLIDDYIFFGRPMNALKTSPAFAILSPTKELQEFYEATHEPTATLLIFSNATQDKVLNFIKKNWREIELTLNVNIHKAKRTRKTIYKERNQAIRALWKEPLNELQKEAGSTMRERDSLVIKILVQRGLAGQELSGGYVRKIANQK